jgi:hypothetical protein
VRGKRLGWNRRRVRSRRLKKLNADQKHKQGEQDHLHPGLIHLDISIRAASIVLVRLNT